MEGMLKKKALEIRLQRLEKYSSRAELEQYNTPADIAADVLHLAHQSGDVEGMKVVDLGCGNGIFAIGAMLLGAASAVGVDVDPGAIEVAERNMRAIGVEVRFVPCDVAEFGERCDTVLQNPPFGAQRSHRHADSLFLRKALGLADVVYSLHLSKTLAFVARTAEASGGTVALTTSYKFKVPHTYKFHTMESREFDVTLVKVVRNGRQEASGSAG